jgi:RNA polymerase sigma-70 factor (ECF subfamily)
MSATSSTDISSTDIASTDIASTHIAAGPAGVSDSEIPLRAVFEAAQSGDSSAFSEIYRRCEPRVRRQLTGRVPSSQIDDLVNETFLRAWRSLQNFRWQGTDPVAWVLVIARNLAADYWSLARNRRELASEDPAIYGPELAQRGAEDVVIDLVEAERLRAAVRRLPPAQRQCLELRFLAERSVRETAEAMGRQDAAVRSLQLRALKSLAAQAQAS